MNNEMQNVFTVSNTYITKLMLFLTLSLKFLEVRRGAVNSKTGVLLSLGTGSDLGSLKPI